MTKHNYLQKDYTTNEREYQVKLPFATEIKIEKDDPVRLLSHYVEEMDLSDLYSTYERVKENQARMNRSIQVEGSFGDLKQDMSFRRFLCRGNPNVLAESILLAMAHNFNKLHRKIQGSRTGTHLFQLKKTS